MTTRLLHGIGELTTNDPTVGDATAMGRLTDAALILDEDVVVWVGPARGAPAADTARDLGGRAVIPGFVDSHTHLVFAGERSDEFEARLQGRPYDGGGIGRTVAATRAASTEQLVAAASARRRLLARGGVTTLEVKSGYELTLEGERRSLAVAATLTDEVTFLGAHVVPAEYAGDREAYVALVAGEMLAACAPLARWADVFCDTGAFSVDEARTILTAARQHGLGLRLHGNQLGPGSGVALAVELQAASVDHCSHLSDDDVAALAGSTTVATLLPGAEFFSGGPPPSGRRLLDAGVTVALATDCNPGTSYLTSMTTAIWLAVREMQMTPDEALWAATAGGARALCRSDVGVLGVGARADLVILDAPRAAHLAYRFGDVIEEVMTAREAPGASRVPA
ncbi:MAG: imidazolonepropionase [Acidimicrobiales bacterium]